MLKKDVNYSVDSVDSLWVSLYNDIAGTIEFTCRKTSGSERISVKLNHEQIEQLGRNISDRLESLKQDKLKKAKALVNAESDD
jgi:hypothetical protein